MLSESGGVDTAIAKVTASVKRIAKEDRNSHGGYNFAGIDDFLAMTGKLCGEAGLSVLMDEAEFEVIPEFFATKSGKVAALRMRFALTLRCAGEIAGPYHRSIMVPSNMGSQAFGAAQSYVLKQFLRATFQIPTGDKGEDIDAHDTGTMTGSYRQQVQQQASDEPTPTHRKPPLQGPIKTRAAVRLAIQALVSDLHGCGDEDMLDVVLHDNRALIDQVEAECPLWWEGDGADFIGLKGEIAAAREACGDNDSIRRQNMMEAG